MSAWNISGKLHLYPIFSDLGNLFALKKAEINLVAVPNKLSRLSGMALQDLKALGKLRQPTAFFVPF